MEEGRVNNRWSQGLREVLKGVVNAPGDEIAARALARNWADSLDGNTAPTAAEVLRKAQALYPDALRNIKLGRRRRRLNSVGALMEEIASVLCLGEDEEEEDEEDDEDDEEDEEEEEEEEEDFEPSDESDKGGKRRRDHEDDDEDNLAAEPTTAKKSALLLAQIAPDIRSLQSARAGKPLSEKDHERIRRLYTTVQEWE